MANAPRSCPPPSSGPRNEAVVEGGAQPMTAAAFTYQVVLVGMGFLADAYDLFVIDMVISILHRLHPEGLAPTDKSLVASATLMGAIFGQLLFGLLGDWLGRRWTFLATCVLIIGGAVMSGCVVWSDGPITLVHQLALCRFVLGVGVGGEYPLAAAITAESSTKEERGRLLASVFSMQGWGMLLSCVVVLLMLWAMIPLEYIWRSALVFGAVPVAAIIVLRGRMEETALFEEAKAREGPAESSAGAHLQASMRQMMKYWHPLVGTAMTWLILDVTFYGTGSFKHRISTIVSNEDAHLEPRDQIWNEAVFAGVCCCAAIPGYLLSVAFMDRIGRFRLQLGGFLAMAVNFGVAACLVAANLRGRARLWPLACFALTLTFSNFGPNTTTFVLPAEVYPTAIRATCHGLSAAAGKVGAVLGTAAFSPAESMVGLEGVLAGCGVVCLLGAAFTWGFTPEEVVDLRELDGLTASDGKLKLSC